MAALNKPPVTEAGRFNGILTWVDQRFPLMALWKSQLSEYYAPKNFNFWYYFGSLALLVLVIQITSGIFLTMNYKPDAASAFASVEYIMRDVPGGWFIRYIHSTGASMFFVCVYLHMVRGLMYGSYRKPRELTWLFGVMIYLALMGEAFFGYLLPWGQMSYWGAQVIINLFGTVPFIGEALAVWIRGDYNVSDATLNRFFALHVVALPLVLLGLVAAHLMALHETGSNNPDGVDLQRHRSEERASEGRHPVPSVLHDQGFLRRRGLPDRVLGDRLLHAGDGRLLPRGEQLHPRRSAEDAGAHRAGVVLHAVLRDAARRSADVPIAVPRRGRDGCGDDDPLPGAVARSRQGEVDPLSGAEVPRDVHALHLRFPGAGLPRRRTHHGVGPIRQGRPADRRRLHRAVGRARADRRLLRFL